MKKLKQLISNVYRIIVVNPKGGKNYISYIGQKGPESHIIADTLLHEIIAGDRLPFEADSQMQEILRQRVRRNGQQNVPVKNSLLDIFIPLFSAGHIEIKMAVVSLALFVLVGLGPKNSQAPDRKIHSFFLADTLGDSSSFHHPAAQDTAFRVQYK